MASQKRKAAGPPVPRAPSEATGAQVLVVRVAEERLGFALKDVGEIVRLQNLAHMPLAPTSLLGLANMRGAVVPVISLRRLLRFPDAPMNDAVRIIIIDRGTPLGFVVDRVETLRNVTAAEFAADRAGAGRLDPNLLDDVIKGDEGTGTIKIVNPDRILQGEFDRIGVSASATRRVAATVEARATVAEPLRGTALVSFDLAGQEYALPLDRVNEIISVPPHVSEIAGSESAVLGVVTLRNRLLPLVSLRALLGLPPRPEGNGRGKVVVVSMGQSRVGVVADRTREILRIDQTSIDPAPALLTRGTGDAEIESICRLDAGRRLVAILSPDNLFRSDLVRRVLSQAGNDNAELETTSGAMTEERFVVFRLGAQEYGMPIAAVAEVTRAPERITRMPKAPAFIDGVINLRGAVLPLVDLCRRFELVSREPAGGRRVLVLSLHGTLAGFMVDAVSELLTVASDAIQPAPELSDEQMRLIGRVVNLKDQGRMILLIDPAALLNENEAGDLTKVARTPDALTT